MDKAIQLRRMKRIPLLLLFLMVALFAYTLNHPASWAAWLHAFSEAGMVGALADWFAVVALFRHPLGIPIPHTAIIPNRKNDIGESMSRFVADHFLEPGVVRKKLQNTNLAAIVVSWLKSEKGRHSVGELTTSDCAGHSVPCMKSGCVSFFPGFLQNNWPMSAWRHYWVTHWSG